MATEQHERIDGYSYWWVPVITLCPSPGLGPEFLIPPRVWLCPTPGLGPDSLISPRDKPSKKPLITLLAAESLVFKGRAWDSMITKFISTRIRKKLIDFLRKAAMEKELKEESRSRDERNVAGLDLDQIMHEIVMLVSDIYIRKGFNHSNGCCVQEPTREVLGLEKKERKVGKKEINDEKKETGKGN